MKKRMLSMLLAIIMVLSLLPVQALAEEPVPDEPVLVIDQHRSRTSVRVDGTVNFTAKLNGGTPTDAVEWTATPADLVEITDGADGYSCTVKGKAEGKVAIHAKMGEVEAADYNLTVFISATSAAITNDTASVEVDNTLQLTYTFKPETIVEKVVAWESSNPDVATVSADGVLTGVAAGSANISLTVNGKTVTKTFTVAAPVTPDAEEKATITASSDEVAVAGKLNLTLNIPEGMTKPDAVDWTFTSSDGGRVILAKNAENELECEVTGEAAGEVTVSASWTDGSETKTATYSLTVAEEENTTDALTILLDGAEVDELILNGRETKTVTASIPTGADPANVQWTATDNLGNVLLDAEGAACGVTGVAEGTLTLTATLKDTELSDTIAVTVNKVDATAFTITNKEALAPLKVGETFQFEYEITPATSTSEVRWDSENIDVVGVTQDGLITAAGEGETKITVTCNGCTDEVTVTVLPQYAVAVDETLPETLLCGNAIPLKAVVMDNGAPVSNARVIWSLQDPLDSDFVILTETGVLTAKPNLENEREITIVASLEGNGAIFDSYTVRLIPRASEIVLTDGANDVTNGFTTLNLADDAVVENGILISADVLPADAGQTVNWNVTDTQNISSSSEYAGGLLIKPASAMRSGSIVVTATADDGTGKSAKVTVRFVRLATDMEIYGAKDSIRGGSSLKLSTNVEKDKTLADRTVIWELNDTEFASISPNGVLTTKAVDEAVTVTVTATAAANPEATDSVTITLCPAVKSIKLSIPGVEGNTATVDFSEGEIALDAVVLPEAAEENVIFISSDTDVAEVDEYGVVTLKDAGRVRITCQADDGSRIKSYVYLVIVKPVGEVEIEAPVDDPDAIELTSGTYMTLKARTLMEDGQTEAENQKVIWSVTDVYGNKTSAATINSRGRLTAKNVNVATEVLVTARSAEDNDIYDTLTVTIKPKRVKEFTLFMDGERLEGTVNLNPNQDYTIEGMWFIKSDGTYEDADDCAFFSSNAKVAVIDENGMLETKASGSTNITVRCQDPESGKLYTTKLTVKVFNVAEELTITDPKVSYLRVGQYVNLYATVWTDRVNEIKATNQSVKWSVYELDGGNMVETDLAAISAYGRLSIKDVITTANIRVVAESLENEGAVDYVDFTIYPKNEYSMYFLFDGEECEDTIFVDYDADLTKLVPMAYKSVFVKDKSGAIVGVDVGDEAPSKTVWTSSNKKVIGINKDGTLALVSTGSAKLTATCTFGNKIYSATINVKVIHQVTEIAVREKIIGQKLYAGKSIVMKATVDAGATNKSVKWALTEDSLEFASINPTTGLIRARREIKQQEKIYVVATAQDGSYVESAPYEVTIYPMATSVKIDGMDAVEYWKVGDEEDLTATVNPDGEADDTVKWSSSRSTVASVDKYGHVVAKRKGTVTITATAVDGSGKSASFKLVIQ